LRSLLPAELLPFPKLHGGHFRGGGDGKNQDFAAPSPEAEAGLETHGALPANAPPPFHRFDHQRRGCLSVPPEDRFSGFGDGPPFGKFSVYSAGYDYPSRLLFPEGNGMALLALAGQEKHLAFIYDSCPDHWVDGQ
jgi:hypothetical protein